MERFGAEGVIEDGLLKGRKFLIPAVVYVEKGTHANGIVDYAKACLRHHHFVSDQGCEDCITEMAAEYAKNKRIGLA